MLRAEIEQCKHCCACNGALRCLVADAPAVYPHYWAKLCATRSQFVWEMLRAEIEQCKHCCACNGALRCLVADAPAVYPHYWVKRGVTRSPLLAAQASDFYLQ